MNTATFWGTLIGFGCLLSGRFDSFAPAARAVETPGHSLAPMPHPSERSGQFQHFNQPLGHKVAVTLGGVGLIGLELWWFVYSQSTARKAITHGGVQAVTVTVDGGYEPSQIVVQAGQPVRLSFDRKDPSRCLDEVRFPDFRIARSLPLNQTTVIEFTPEKPGRYEFTCGMNMFRGVVEVQDTQSITESPDRVSRSVELKSRNHPKECEFNNV